MKLQYSLRSFLLLLLLSPPLLWLGWKYELVKAHYYHGEGYTINDENGWVAGVYVFRFGIEAWGSPNGPTSWQLVRENVPDQRHPYYSKKIFYTSW